ncbi:uncharacterized protein [Euwallacea fornicatus]|uniref:uncharacterized protein isoform X1 n=1 Tax=Euwallacea fornicatus TaxID=995702 RepID=UPI00338F6110
MDYLSNSQLQSYESVINKIDQQHETYQKLTRQIQKLNNELTIANLAKLKHKFKIGHINVKIFSDLADLFNLYRDEIQQSLYEFCKSVNCKFYLIEVFITETLQKKLEGLSWSLWICLKYQGTCVNKIVNIEDKINIPLMYVLAIDQGVVDCTVSAFLRLNSEDRLIMVNLDNVKIDISYHFETSKKSKHLSKDRKILNTACSYDNDNFLLNLDLHKPLLMEFQFLTKINNKALIDLFIKNCYHKLDIEQFSELAGDPKGNFVLKFSTGAQKHSLTLDKVSRIVTLKSNLTDLRKLKEYFESAIQVRDQRKIDETLRRLNNSLNDVCDDKEELCRIYRCLRHIWSK